MPIFQHSNIPLLSQERDAAIDVDGLSGDKVAQGRGEKQHRADDVIGYLDALQGAQVDRRFSELDHLIRWIFFGKGIAGRQTVDVYIVFADFPSKGARKTDGCGFGRDIVNSSRRAGEDGARSDVDDLAASLRAHRREHRAAAEEEAP